MNYNFYRVATDVFVIYLMTKRVCIFLKGPSGLFCCMVLKCIRKPECACDQVAEVLLRVPVTLNLTPVFGGILIVLAHPGRDGNLRGMEPEPGKKIHEIACHMLHTINMADNDHSSDFVVDHPVPEPRVLVLNGIHPLNKFLDNR